MWPSESDKKVWRTLRSVLPQAFFAQSLDSQKKFTTSEKNPLDRFKISRLS